MLQILFAALAGMLTIAAPCILPLLPVLLGASIGHRSKTRPLFIVAGFIVVFSAAAVLLSFLSQHFGFASGAVRDVGIAVLAIFGLLLIWPGPLDALMGRLMPFVSRASAAGGTGSSNGGAFVLGMTLVVVWTPCAGPVLASILTLIALQKELLTAGILLVSYAIGASVPMLVIAYGGQLVSTRVEWLSRYSRTIQQVFGVIIILLAIAIYFNYDTLLYTKLLSIAPFCSAKL